MTCFYCQRPQSATCERCGAAICDQHSTEDSECYDRCARIALHLEHGEEEWIEQSLTETAINT